MSNITVEQIQSSIESFGSDNVAVCGGTHEGGIYGQQIPDELAFCIWDLMKYRNAVAPSYTNMLEIGSASGASAFMFSHFLNLENVVIIDDNRHKRHIHRERILKGVNYKEFVGDSHSKEAFDFVADLGLVYDIILIDGDHSYEGVKKDTEMYFRFSDYLGYVVYHDVVACAGVKRYFEELQDPNVERPDLHFIKKYKSTKHPNPLGIGVFKSFNINWFGMGLK